MQFGFKRVFYHLVYSTGILKTVVDRYITWSSIVYACLILIDAFDNVYLFKKLLEGGIPVLARFIWYWYHHSQLG